MTRPSAQTFLERLSDGVMIGAEGYVFELERRGYIKAGPYVPEVILDAPDALRQLHREFLRAGSDVMVAPARIRQMNASVKLCCAKTNDPSRAKPETIRKGHTRLLRRCVLSEMNATTSMAITAAR